MQTIAVAWAPASRLPEVIGDGIDTYCSNVLALLDERPEIAAVELLGSVEGLHVDGYGRATQWYGEWLSVVCARLHDERPDVLLLPGGFGNSASPWFLVEGLIPSLPPIDVCNLHPFATPFTNEIDAARQYEDNLSSLHELIDTHYGGIPIWCSAFGVPSIAESIDDEYGGRLVLSGNCQAVGPDEACAWYQAIIERLDAAGVAVCCLLAHDRDSAHRNATGYSGLVAADGKPKPWFNELILWLQDRPGAGYMFDVSEEV